MMGNLLLYIGSAVIIVWGIAHIVPTRSVVNGFGSILPDNRRIITMEWVAEGLTLCFIGLLVLLITLLAQAESLASDIVYRVSGIMLLVMAGWTLATGARTLIIPIRICPVVKTIVATLFIVGSFL
jgi:hypothetical protein